ncbi:MAG: alpha/beta hydrolase [Cyanobium sp.]
MLLSLLLGLAPAGAAGGSATAAELLEIRFDDLTIPIPLDQLAAFSLGEPPAPGSSGDELTVWLGLMHPRSRQDLRILLRAPLLQDRSFGRQLLDSWAGGQMLEEVGDLLTTSDGTSTTTLLQGTLRQLLQQGRPVTAIELLRSLPPARLTLQLDGLLALAERWRQQLQQQQLALQGLQRLALPARRSLPLAQVVTQVPPMRPLSLVVPHRPEPLPLEIWSGRPGRAGSPSSRPWLLLMPGLGGTAEQLGWLAGTLADRGWSAVVLQHPGSDAAALRAALAGQRPPPGAEALATRLDDVAAVLAAQRQGRLGIGGDGVVLMGHSLGGLTALLAAGLEPVAGLENRCRQALVRLPINNPSRLLQCQLASTGLPRTPQPPVDLRGVVVLNGFGSLLWPGRGLAPLPVPVLMAGGSLDLVTPPLEEQLGLFLPAGDPRSRLVMVDGGSHFSPVRVAAEEEVLFRLGSELVGVEPQAVQRLLLRLTSEFLQTLSQPLLLSSQRLSQEGVTAYVLDPAAARRWRRLVGR